MLREMQPHGVIVCTPTEDHLKPVLASIELNTHVLVEKPIAPSLEQAQQIIEHSKRFNKHVIVGHHRRYSEQIQQTKQIIGNGILGQLVGVSGIWATRKPDSYFEPEWRKKRTSGPVLINLIHEIDIFRHVCGEISSISATVTSGIRQHPKEETTAVLLQFQSGVLGTFLLSDVTPSPWTWEQATGENPRFPKSLQNVYRFIGTKASLDFPNLIVWRHVGNESDWHQEINAEVFECNVRDAYDEQIRHFCAVINNKEQPRIDAVDATKTLKATLAVFEASEKGIRVQL
jgi:predicted dehydrogenase